MQVGIDVKCMYTNFGERDPSGFRLIITKNLYHENNGAVQYKHYRFMKTLSAKWSLVTVPLIC